jgi:CheY-like chemotaxis protein
MIRESGMSATTLTGKRILLVEDESIIAMLFEDMLTDSGCEIVGVASDLNSALEKISTLEFDAAILDVNLKGKPSFPAAEALGKRGIGYVFATGYGGQGIPPEYRDVPRLDKPFQHAALETAIEAALGYKPK